MIVLDVQKGTEKIKGILSRYLIEIRPGLFTGSLSKRVIGQLWEDVVASNPGSACLVYPSKNESGIQIVSTGSSKFKVGDNFGLPLMSFVSKTVTKQKTTKAV